MNDAPPPSYRLAREGSVVHVRGDLTIVDAAGLWKDLRGATAGVKGGGVDVDLSELESADGAIVAILVDIRSELAERGVHLELKGANDTLAPLLELYTGDPDAKRTKKRRPESTVAHVGRATIEILEEFKQILSFVGEMLIAAIRLVRSPKSGHWKEIPPLAEKAGADALPITLLINFLVGFVMAYQAAKQLKMFGANIYVADLVGLSVTRELGPLMTAIIICGRSGAAFAAEIGSMKVSEEVDALRTLGLPPFGWLVVPRVFALLITAPLLTLLGDFIGLIGGLFVGVTSLDLTVHGYYLETIKAVKLMDIGTGLIKSLVFALTIGLIACQQGFSASGGAEGVGKRTTKTVVASLFALVLLDAAFTMVFRVFDL